MTQEGSSLTKQLIYLGILLQGLGFSRLFDAILPHDVPIFLGAILLMIGIMRFAQARSRSRAWGLLGYIPFFGLLILAFLQDSKTGRYPIADSDGLNLSGGLFGTFSKSWFNWAWVPVFWLVWFFDCLSISFLMDHAINQRVIATCCLILPLTYICSLIIFNKTTVNIHSKRIDIRHSPLPWKKNLSIKADEIVNVFHRGGQSVHPISTPVSSRASIKMWGEIFKKIFPRYHVWIQTKSGLFKIITFCEKNNAVAAVNEIKASMHVVDIVPAVATTPPESGSWV